MNYKYKVGDWRVQFSYAGRHGEEFTVVRNELFSRKNCSFHFQVGRQSGREIRPYQTSAGEDILLLRQGLR